jgi:2-keto-4-pentenoate hydratase
VTGAKPEADAAAIEAAATSLIEAQRSGVTIAPLRDRFAGGGDVAVAYEIQRRVTARAIADGRRIVGRKIGLTSQAIQKQIGVDSPDFGTLFHDLAFIDGEPIPWQRLLQPKVEAEIALVLEADLDREHLVVSDVVSATAYALPAIEVVDSRIANWDIRLLDTIADNASSGVYVVGTTPRRLCDFDARLCGMVMSRGGQAISLGVGAACLGHPVNAALWLARKMVELGSPLRAGDIVLTGALGPMVAVQPGDVVLGEIAGLGSVTAVFGR